MLNWIGDVCHADTYDLRLTICAKVRLFGSMEKAELLR